MSHLPRESALDQNLKVEGKTLIYLDYHATTPCDPRVVQAMMPYLTQHYGNPHSRTHVMGWNAEEAVEKAREQVAHLVGASAKDIVFTSGATEANNLALKGVAWFYRQKNPLTSSNAPSFDMPHRPGHIITSVIEHKCVLDTLSALEREGFEITYLPVASSGLIDLQDLRDAFRPDTFLVSIGAANGEIGTIQPMAAIGAICREKSVYFHTDAAQALGKIPLNVEAMNIDLMSLSSHKIYGPKGIGALYVRRRPRVRLQPLFHGGGQERGLRSGTVAPFLCVGFGAACDYAGQEMEGESQRLLTWRKEFYHNLSQRLEAIYLNGHEEQRLPGNLNISFLGVEGEGFMAYVPHIALSSGSACTSASLEPSYILQALNVPSELAHSSIRFSFGRFTTHEEIQRALEDIVQAVGELRALSPLWDMHKEGIDLSTIQWTGH